MTMPRKLLVDIEVSRFYHCISRCVRRAYLCGDGFEHRKQWIEDRLKELADSFAVAVCGYAIMDNHLHVLARLDPELAENWSDEEVLRRWLTVYPPKSADGEILEVTKHRINEEMKNLDQITKMRTRLTNLGWFMKALKEPLSRMANKEDNCKGTFWEGRYKSIAILDEEALLATCAYIDLNPISAGIALTPEDSKHTSFRNRFQHLTNPLETSTEEIDRKLVREIEESCWLCPFDDIESNVKNRSKSESKRRGMLSGFSFFDYIKLVVFSSRILGNDKPSVSQELSDLFDRMDSSPETWSLRIRGLLEKSRLMGNFFSTKKIHIQKLAEKRGRHHLVNIASSTSR